VGVWYHVVGTYDGTTIKQWVDGTLLGTTRTITATTTANGGPVRIARRWDGLPTDAAQFFTGDIAVAKIYDGVLTDEEIVAAYEATSATYPNYTLTPAANNVNEGSSLEFTVSGNRITDGTYYWTIDSNSVDFGTASGSFSITNNSGTFSVTPSADATTEGEQIFDVEVRSGAVDGPVLVSSGNIIINDTSLTKLQLTSGEALGFNGVDNRHVIVADNLADWDLGDNWTIEWWHKIPVGVDGFLSVLCQDANVPTYSGIDVFVNAGNICMFNGNLSFAEAAATRDEWNHIAIQKNGTSLAAYINGVAQTLGGSHPGTIAPSSPLNVCIGSRTYDGGANFYGQYFNGQLANIRISSIARYTGTFTPPTTVEYDVNTKLALDGSVGGGGMLVDELTRHTLTNNGATIDTID
jgi:hypothetical protein